MRALKPNEIEPRPWYESGQALHELERRQDDVGGAVPVGAFQLQYNVTGAVEFEPFIGDGGAGDIAAQLLGLTTLIHGAAHRGVEAKALLVGTVWGRLRLKARDGLQTQNLLARAGSECNTVGAGRRLQRRHGDYPYHQFRPCRAYPALQSDSQGVSTTS